MSTASPHIRTRRMRRKTQFLPETIVESGGKKNVDLLFFRLEENKQIVGIWRCRLDIKVIIKNIVSAILLLHLFT